jgi:biopolymer transport protein ExbD
MRSLVYIRGRARIGANLTPMIDVTFLLIVFFVLVSQIVEVENVELSVPELDEPATEMLGEEQRAVINVVPGRAGRAAEYRIGAQPFPPDSAGIAALTDRLTRLFEANPNLRINLRADQRTEYRDVQPIIEAVTTAAGRVEAASVRPRINLVIVREDAS